MKIGVIGCGVIAYWAHLRALRRIPGVTLAAAADPLPAARERARRLTGATVYDTAEELLARPDIGAVVIAAPTHLHAALAVAAAASAKHFYLEKPIATTAADADRVVSAVGASGVVGVIGFNRRLHPLYLQVRALLQGGAIGSVQAVQTVCTEPMPAAGMPEWKRARASGGGVLLDLASHHFDLLRWLLRDEISEVTASRLRSDCSEQDVAWVELTTHGGVPVQSFFSFRSGRADLLQFVGERGTLRADRHGGGLALRLGRRFGYGARRGWTIPSPGLVAWRLHRLLRPSADPSYRRALQAFVRAIGGGSGPIPTLDDGVRSLRAVLQAEQADRERLQVADARARAACAPS